MSAPTATEILEAAGDRYGARDVLSVDDVERAAGELSGGRPDAGRLERLCRGPPFVAIDGLVAGYGRMEILHGLDLRVSQGESLCLIGPNGAGKSTVLHSIQGFTQIMSGTIHVGGKDVTRMPAQRKLRDAGIAYVLQDNSVFPDMSVEENLLMGGYLLPHSRVRCG